MLEYCVPKAEVVFIDTADVILTSQQPGFLPGGNSGTETPDDDLWG